MDNPEKRNGIGIYTAVASTASLIAVVFLAVVILYTITGSKELEKRTEDLEAEVSALAVTEPPVTTVETTAAQTVALPENIAEGKIYVGDSELGEIWLPIISGLPLNDYYTGSFVSGDDGRLTYYTADNRHGSYSGIDVSSFQGEIDWEQVYNDGIDFAMIRVGFRGYGEDGNIKEDTQFRKNLDGAMAAGLEVGVYFYSQATSVNEAVDEADFVLDVLSGAELDLPVVFDWELVEEHEEDVTPRTDGVSSRMLNYMAVAFCDTIEGAGYSSMVYGKGTALLMRYDLRILSGRKIWLSDFTGILNFPYELDIWQYGMCAVDGIEGPVDMNVRLR